MRLVTTDYCLFTEPGKLDYNPDLSKNLSITAATISYYEVMEKTLRSLSGKVSLGKDDSTVVSTHPRPGDSAAVVSTEDGRIIGVLAGKTDAYEPGGGPDEYLPLSTFESLLHRIKSSSSGRASKSRVITPIKAKGRYFIVHAVLGERFED